MAFPPYSTPVMRHFTPKGSSAPLVIGEETPPSSLFVSCRSQEEKGRSIQSPSTDCGGDDTVLWPNASSVRTGVPIRGRTSREIPFVLSGLEDITFEPRTPACYRNANLIFACFLSQQHSLSETTCSSHYCTNRVASSGRASSQLAVTHYPTSHAITPSSGNVSRRTHAPKTSSAFDIPHSHRRTSRVSGWPSRWGNVSHPQRAYLKRAWIRPRVGLMVNKQFQRCDRFRLFSVASIDFQALVWLPFHAIPHTLR